TKGISKEVLFVIIRAAMDLITQFLKSKQHHETGSLRHVADSVWRKKSKILAIAKKNETPFYLIDDAELNKSIGEFESGFRKPLRQSRFFYAIKTNYHPHILRTAVKRGWGLDASSGRELDLALQAGARQILFTGPGKTDKELALAQKHAGRVILNIDNFSELARVGKLLRGKTTKLRAGVRFFSKLHETWSKFGIPLKDLGRFWHQAGKIRNLELSGVQFHSSLNRFPGRNAKIIAELGGYLKSKFPKTFLEEIKFIDIGGGYYPDNIEGYYPWSASYPWTLSPGHFQKLSASALGKPVTFKQRYYITRAASPEAFAKEIASAIRENLQPLVNAEIFLEPGRIIATRAMHLVLKVVDVKDGLAVTDGGINMTGWEFGQNFYLPIVNISNFARQEINFPLYGSLCTPRDFWGYYIYAKKITSGDVIVIPNQGAYRFTLAQEFIKPIPPAYLLK
ncbi:MAG: hypothetical protein A2668_02825, partial [Candidatus Doudnabacteria bacterium RIFCSPHIGHO2_01_FULL_48_180]